MVFPNPRNLFIILRFFLTLCDRTIQEYIIISIIKPIVNKINYRINSIIFDTVYSKYPLKQYY